MGIDVFEGNVRIKSNGNPHDTSVSVDGVDLKGVISVEISKIDCDSGPLTATIKLMTDDVDVVCDAVSAELEEMAIPDDATQSDTDPGIWYSHGFDSGKPPFAIIDKSGECIYTAGTGTAMGSFVSGYFKGAQEDPYLLITNGLGAMPSNLDVTEPPKPPGPLNTVLNEDGIPSPQQACAITAAILATAGLAVAFAVWFSNA